MLEDELEKLVIKYKIDDKKAITYGHFNVKTNFVLPLPGITIYEQTGLNFFFIYFDKNGITFFPLNEKNQVTSKSFISWNDIKDFKYKNGLLLEDEMIITLNNETLKVKIAKFKACNEWLKDNNTYLKSNNHFYK